MADAAPILQLKQLGCARGGVSLLGGVDFSLFAGQIVELRGFNGIGKTSLLRTIAGLQPPTAGQVIAADDTLAYAAHADGIKSGLSVAENLQFWQSTYRAGGYATALDAFDLRALKDRPAGQLSAGQKRRLGLARLMVTGRPVWLMDEPTVSLDGHARAKLAGILRAHANGGGAALVATHIPLGLDAPTLDLTPYATLRDSTDQSFAGDWL